MSSWSTAHRPMKYPYTITAKAALFPYKYYWQHCWLFKYWCISVVCCIPVFYKIQQLSYSPANVEKWTKIWEETFKGPPGPH